MNQNVSTPLIAWSDLTNCGVYFKLQYLQAFCSKTRRLSVGCRFNLLPLYSVSIQTLAVLIFLLSSLSSGVLFKLCNRFIYVLSNTVLWLVLLLLISFFSDRYECIKVELLIEVRLSAMIPVALLMGTGWQKRKIWVEQVGKKLP